MGLKSRLQVETLNEHLAAEIVNIICIIIHLCLAPIKTRKRASLRRPGSVYLLIMHQISVDFCTILAATQQSVFTLTIKASIFINIHGLIAVLSLGNVLTL